MHSPSISIREHVKRPAWEDAQRRPSISMQEDAFAKVLVCDPWLCPCGYPKTAQNKGE